MFHRFRSPDNMIRFRVFGEAGGFVRDEAGRYRVDVPKMREAVRALCRTLLTLQGIGDYAAAKPDRLCAAGKGRGEFNFGVEVCISKEDTVTWKSRQRRVGEPPSQFGADCCFHAFIAPTSDREATPGRQHRLANSRPVQPVDGCLHQLASGKWQRVADRACVEG